MSDKLLNQYTDFLVKAEIIEYGPTKGSMFWLPYGYKIWKLIQEYLNQKFDQLNVKEVYFPLLIPKSLFEKEKQHIKGFNPELFKITNIGDEVLTDHLLLRPTSEVLFNYLFSKKLKSYKQLPLKYNQWVNIIRAENNTKAFLRNSEFLWQEGHTNHETEEEAIEFTKKIWNLYEEFLKEKLLLTAIKGEKPKSEKFAGAQNTFTIETLLKDGQSLQTATSHYLGTNFSKAMKVLVKGKDNKDFNPYQTSWGLSSRAIGAILMSHIDEKGFLLPSSIAPYQVVILNFLGNFKSEQKEKDYANFISRITWPYWLEISYEKTKIRWFIDKSTKDSFDENDYINQQYEKNNKIQKNEIQTKSFQIEIFEKQLGFKSQEWELKGAPIRIELWSKEFFEQKKIILVRRDQEKREISIREIEDEYKKENELVISLTSKELKNKGVTNYDDPKILLNPSIEWFLKKELKEYDEELAKRTKNMENNIVILDGSKNSIKDVIQNIKKGKFVKCGWIEDELQEQQLKQECGATIRCLIDTTDEIKCIHSKKSTNKYALIARAY